MTRRFNAMAKGSWMVGSLALAAGVAMGACAAPTTEEAGVSADSLRRLQGEEALFLKTINEYRASKGLGALVATQLLNQVAYDHSLDMAVNGYFDHNDLEGRSPFTRMQLAGYKGGAMAENIAAGNSTAAATFTQWKNSPGHDANMLGTRYKAIGIGVACLSSSPYNCYWTTDFGDVVDGSAETGGGTTTDAGTSTDAGSAPPPPAPSPSPPPPSPECPTEADANNAGNNTYTSANPLGPLTCGAIGVAGDVDWFKWTSSTPFALSFADATGLQLTTWRLSNGYYRTVAPTNGSYAAGTYYARITAASGGTPSYRLTRTP